jgi:hypothetical protein
MNQREFEAILLLGVCITVGGLAVAAQPPPRIRIAMPAGTSAEFAIIDYFLTGPFGGYGEYVSGVKGQSEYEIAADVRGVPAENIKLIAYISGCQFQKFDIALHSLEETLQLYCTHLSQIPLSGKLELGSILPSGSRIEITYLADWGGHFFGIADGPVPAFHVADAVPGEDGFFEVSLPDFGAQDLGEGEFQFILREAKSGNFLELHPLDDPSPFRGLKVQASYPTIVRFGTD